MELDLSTFCATEEYARYNLTRPFISNWFRYATDGVIAIRVKAEHAADTEGKLPRIGLLFAECPEDISPRYFTMPDTLPCGLCKSNGTVECPTCKAPHQCHRCRGTGFGDVVFDDIHFARNYIDKITSLPNLRIAVEHNETRLWFWFAGGEGCLMGMQTVPHG